MDSELMKNNRKLVMSLLLCAGFISGNPLVAVAGSGDLSVQGVTQSTTNPKRTLLGTVVDASTGEALIGVNIRLKGTDTGTITDIDGKFSIEVTSKSELLVSYIGYKSQELVVGDLGVMTIKMESDNEVLDEVVVVGQGTQKKVSVTGSITTVKGATLKAPSSSLTDGLQDCCAIVRSPTRWCTVFR